LGVNRSRCAQHGKGCLHRFWPCPAIEVSQCVFYFIKHMKQFSPIYFQGRFSKISIHRLVNRRSIMMNPIAQLSKACLSTLNRFAPKCRPALRLRFKMCKNICYLLTVVELRHSSRYGINRVQEKTSGMKSHGSSSEHSWVRTEV